MVLRKLKKLRDLLVGLLKRGYQYEELVAEKQLWHNPGPRKPIILGIGSVLYDNETEEPYGISDWHFSTINMDGPVRPIFLNTSGKMLIMGRTLDEYIEIASRAEEFITYEENSDDSEPGKEPSDQDK